MEVKTLIKTREQLFELGQRIAYAVDEGRDDTVERLLREFARDEVAAALEFHEASDRR